MLTVQEACELLRAITFKIRIEKHPQGYWEWGTGFFISIDGYALTAFHNLPKSVIKAGGGAIDAFYDEQELTFECLMDLSLPEYEGDVAVLKLRDPSTKPIHSLPIAYLSLDLPFQQRNKFWAGRPVCAFGFPFERTGQGERFVDGNIDSAQPLAEVDAKDLGGAGPNITGTVEWLRFYGGARAKELAGISGAPILDRETGWIVAVEHRYDPELDIIYGTEIARLLERWPQEMRSAAKSLPLALTPFKLITAHWRLVLATFILLAVVIGYWLTSRPPPLGDVLNLLEKVITGEARIGCFEPYGKAEYKLEDSRLYIHYYDLSNGYNGCYINFSFNTAGYKTLVINAEGQPNGSEDKPKEFTVELKKEREVVVQYRISPSTQDVSRPIPPKGTIDQITVVFFADKVGSPEGTIYINKFVVSREE